MDSCAKEQAQPPGSWHWHRGHSMILNTSCCSSTGEKFGSRADCSQLRPSCEVEALLPEIYSAWDARRRKTACPPPSWHMSCMLMMKKKARPPPTQRHPWRWLLSEITCHYFQEPPPPAGSQASSLCRPPRTSPSRSPADVLIPSCSVRTLSKPHSTSPQNQHKSDVVGNVTAACSATAALFARSFEADSSSTCSWGADWQLPS